MGEMYKNATMKTVRIGVWYERYERLYDAEYV